MRIPFLILAITFLFACGKADKEEPSIYVTAPVQGKLYRINDTIFYDLTFVDNKELDNYQISIVHSDSFVINNLFGNLLAPLNKSVTNALNSNTVFASDYFIIDQSVAAGNYNFIVSAADKEGNASVKTVPFHISNQYDTIAPVIDSLIIPAEITALPVSINAQLNDQNLAVLQYYVIRQSSLDTIVYRNFSLSSTFNTFNDTFSVSNGSYRLKMKVRDAMNNQSDREATFIVQ